MIKTVVPLFFIIIIVVNSSFATQSPQQWSDINSKIVMKNDKVKAVVASVSADISDRRQSLQQQLQSIKVKSLQTKKTAEQLRVSLQKHQQREAELKQLLLAKQKTLEKIEATVRSNAKFVLTSGNNYDVSSITPESLQQLQKVSNGDKFPSLANINNLNQILLNNINKSGQLSLQREIIFNRNGVAVEAQVLHYGNFQNIYRYGNEVGFLISDPIANSLRVANYLPDATQAENINSVFDQTTNTGNKLINIESLPVDISGGTFINNSPASSRLWSVVSSGGLFIWPIILLAVVGVVLVLERFLVLYRINVNGTQAVARVTELLTTKLLTPAESVVGAVALVKDESLEVRECRMEEAILEQLPKLERFLQTIKIMATIAPLLGLLGTVSGIIQTFQVISTSGNGDPKLLSAGISEALLTTEAGLLVAIPLLLCHHFLQLRVKTLVLDMESAGAAMLSPSIRKDFI